MSESNLHIEHATEIAILKTKFEAMDQELKDISGKLDSLLELKAKGMGAIGRS